MSGVEQRYQLTLTVTSPDAEVIARVMDSLSRTALGIRMAENAEVILEPDRYQVHCVHAHDGGGEGP